MKDLKQALPEKTQTGTTVIDSGVKVEVSDDKFVLLTGAFGGMGKAVQKMLSNAGYKVFACDLVVEEGGDENIIPIKLDVTSDEDIAKAKEKICKHTEKLFAIVNLAGIFKMNTLLEVDESLFRKTVEVNFWGTFKINRAFFDMLQKGSKIINMSSEVAKYSVPPFNSVYTIPKILVDSYSDGLRRELKYLGVQVVKIRSGSFKTNLLGDAEGAYNQLIDNTKYYKKELTTFKKFVMGELKKQNNPDKIAKLILKILNKKKAKRVYHIKNSFKLKLLGGMPEGLQDVIYKIVIK